MQINSSYSSVQLYRDFPVQTILIIPFTSERSERENFFGCTRILANVQGYYSNRLAGMLMGCDISAFM